jgi:putative transposase
VVLGWTLVVGSPSESDGLHCVESVLFSKQVAFDRLGLAGQIGLDACGTPNVLVLDNGPEGKGQRMSRLGGIGITLQYCKSRHPHEKPFIERLNRALKRAMQRLRGSTRHNDKDGNRDPVQAGDRLMTLEELERWIVRWYYQSWAKHELERHVRDNFVEPVKLGRTPEERWTNINKRGYPARPSPSTAHWQMTCFEHQERKLNRKTGITYEGFEYVGAHLKGLINRFGECTVKCLIDPEDYRQIFVYTAEDEPLVPLVERYARPESPAYSFAEMKVRRSELKPQPSADPVSKQFDEDMRQEAVAAAAAPAPTSRKARNQVATRTARETDAVNRASKKPLNSPRKDTFMNTEQVLSFSLGPVPELRVVNRSTGEATQ